MVTQFHGQVYEVIYLNKVPLKHRGNIFYYVFIQKIIQFEVPCQLLHFQVAGNPYHYDSHVELIKLLRQSGDLDKVRNAREDMSKIFPLTEGKVMAFFNKMLLNPF